MSRRVSGLGRKHAPRLSTVGDRKARVPAAADPNGRRRLRTLSGRWGSRSGSGTFRPVPSLAPAPDAPPPCTQAPANHPSRSLGPLRDGYLTPVPHRRRLRGGPRAVCHAPPADATLGPASAARAVELPVPRATPQSDCPSSMRRSAICSASSIAFAAGCLSISWLGERSYGKAQDLDAGTFRCAGGVFR